MIFKSLASSSKGNAYVVDDGSTKILLDCGITYKELQKRLGFQVTDIAACLITHEHKDHAKCYNQLIKNGMPIYASEGTIEALDCNLIGALEPKEVMEIGTFSIIPFEVFHDSIQPFGYLIRSNVTNEKLMFATDTVNLPYVFQRLTHIAIECNHSAEMLSRCTRLPEKTAERISNTHFEVNNVAGYLSNLNLSSCKEIYLLHLSDTHSSDSLFQDIVQRACPNSKVIVCDR